jgi:hypothetical protein
MVPPGPADGLLDSLEGAFASLPALKRSPA